MGPTLLLVIGLGATVWWVANSFAAPKSIENEASTRSKSAEELEKKLNAVLEENQRLKEKISLPEESNTQKNTSKTLDEEAQKRVMRMVREKQLSREKNPMEEVSAGVLACAVILAFGLFGALYWGFTDWKSRQPVRGPSPCDCIVPLQKGSSHKEYQECKEWYMAQRFAYDKCAKQQGRAIPLY